MTKPKDCGCGGGKNCITKRKGGSNEMEQDDVTRAMNAKINTLVKSGLSPQDAIQQVKEQEQPKLEGQGVVNYLIRKYKEKYPNITLKGKALQKHMENFCAEHMKELDCGCGCKGKKELLRRGGALKDCPAGYSKYGELLCKKDCPPGYRDDGVACRGCPPGYKDMGLSCFKDLSCETYCDGNWSWSDGGFCHTRCSGPDSQQQSVIWKDTFERIDWEKTGDDIKKGFEDAFSKDGALANAFDPEKNGVAESFRKFGKDTEAAFEDLGKKIEAGFDPNQNGVAEAFKKFGEEMGKTVGDEQWWRDTMSDPDTYVNILVAVTTVAALVLSGGTAGPVAIAALSAIGPAASLINDAAQGRPVDPLDIASLALSIVPMGASVAGVFDDGVKAGIKAFEAGNKSKQLGQAGKALAKATEAAGKLATSKVGKVAVKQLSKFARYADDVIELGGQVFAVLKDPSSIKTFFNSLSSTWSTLSKAEKAQKATELGLKAYQKGKLALKVAGDVQQLIEVPLSQVNWDYEENYDYALPDEVVGTSPAPLRMAAPPVTTEMEKNRIAFIEKYGISPESYLVEVEPNSPEENALIEKAGGDWNTLFVEAAAASGWQGQAAGFVNNPRYKAGPRTIPSKLESSSGSGKNRKSNHSTNMVGTGTDSDYLAYMGIEDKFVGSGRTHSWERHYDDVQEQNHRMKMDMVRRRVEQRTVKIRPYTERPELLTDTFKVGPYGRDITGQIAGGNNSYFNPPEDHSSHLEMNGGKKKKLKGGDVVQAPNKTNKVDFYYPSFSGREARGVASSTEQAAMPQGVTLSSLNMF